MLCSGMSRLLGLMLVAGDVQQLVARTPWPLHTALRELGDEAGRRGLLRETLPKIRTRPSAEVGLQVEGADAAVNALLAEGLLVETGRGRDARLVVDAQVSVEYRRRLMRLDPGAVRLLQRAGARWSALSWTSEKNWSSAPRSSGETVIAATA